MLCYWGGNEVEASATDRVPGDSGCDAHLSSSHHARRAPEQRFLRLNDEPPAVASAVGRPAGGFVADRRYGVLRRWGGCDMSRSGWFNTWLTVGHADIHESKAHIALVFAERVAGES